MRLTKFLFVGIILLLITSCLKKPGLPQWYSTYSFPILHDTLRIWDMIRDTEHVVIGPDSVLTFTASMDIDTIWPAESLYVEEFDTTTRYGFGKLVVRNITSRGVRISWQNFPLPDSIIDTIMHHQYDSIRILLPTLLPDTVTDTTDTLTRFSWAGINSASIHIHFENNFPVTISPYNIWIYSLDEHGDTTLVFEGDIDNIRAYHIIDTTLTIDSVFTTNRLRLIEFMGIPGGDSVYVSARNNFFVQVSIDSIVVDSARAFFPGFTINDTFNVPLNFEEGSIDTVIMRSGGLYLDVYNPLLISMMVHLHTDNLWLDHEPFDTTIHILPDSLTHIYLDLTDRMITVGDSGLSLEVSTDIDSQWIQIHDYDSVEVTVAADTLMLKYVAGTFDSVSNDIPEVDTTLDIPDTLNFRLVHVFLDGNITQSMNFAPEINLVVKNIGENDTIIDTFNIQLRPGSHNSPSTTPVSLDLSRILSIPPHRVSVGGYVLIDGHGSTYYNDFATGHFNIVVPFSVVFNPDTIIPDTSIDSMEVDTEIIDRLDRAVLYVRLRNRIPIGLSADFHMISDAGDTLIKSFTIPPAPHDVNGLATGEKDTTLVFTLTHDEATIFEATQQTSWINIYIPQTDTVTVRGSDYMIIDVIGEIRARMGE